LTPEAMGTEEYNQIFDNFIRRQKKQAHIDMKESILRFNQSSPGICMADGRILSGNCRFAALRDLQEHSETRYYFQTGIVTDADYSINDKEIKLLELIAQNSIHVHSDYAPFNRLCDFAQSVLIKKICTKDEYLSTYPIPKKSRVQQEVSCAELLLELCTFLNIEYDHMHLLKKYPINGPLDECRKMLGNVNNDEDHALYRSKIKEYIFSEIVIPASKNSNERARTARSILEGLSKADAMPLLDSHHEAVVAPLKEIIRQVKEEPDFTKSPESLKKLLDARISQRDENGNSLKNIARIWVSQKASEKEALDANGSQIKQVRLSLDALKAMDRQIFHLLNEDQKQLLVSELSSLQQLAQSLTEALREPVDPDV